MIGLLCSEKNYKNTGILSHFHKIRDVTDRQTDGRTDRTAISVSLVSVLMHDNKQ